jgi:hypothetical protein
LLKFFKDVTETKSYDVYYFSLGNLRGIWPVAVYRELSFDADDTFLFVTVAYGVTLYCGEKLTEDEREALRNFSRTIIEVLDVPENNIDASDDDTRVRIRIHEEERFRHEGKD